MKDCVIRFRISEAEKETVEKLAEASPYTNGMSDYIMELIREDAKHYHLIDVEAVVKGLNKEKTETIVKRRVLLGDILVDADGRGTVKQYDKLIAEAEKELADIASRPNHYIRLEVNGKEVKRPAPMGDFVRFE